MEKKKGGGFHLFRLVSLITLDFKHEKVSISKFLNRKGLKTSIRRIMIEEFQRQLKFIQGRELLHDLNTP